MNIWRTNYLKKNTSIIGFLDPLDPVDTDDHVAAWQALGITTFSVDLFKSLSINDPKNMQAAMSHIAGRLALQDGLKRYSSKNSVKLTFLARRISAKTPLEIGPKTQIGS